MTQVLVTESHLNDVAEAIRAKNGAATLYKPGQMAAAIAALPDAPDLGTKSVTANGTYSASSDDLDGYSSVTVNVPNSYAASDEGKVVSNGALVAQTSTTVTQNGTVDTTLNDEVVVNVSGGGGGSSNIISGPDEPTASVGSDGDVYLVTNPTVLPSEYQAVEHILFPGVSNRQHIVIGSMRNVSEGQTYVLIDLTIPEGAVQQTDGAVLARHSIRSNTSLVDDAAIQVFPGNSLRSWARNVYGEFVITGASGVSRNSSAPQWIYGNLPEESRLTIEAIAVMNTRTDIGLLVGNYNGYSGENTHSSNFRLHRITFLGIDRVPYACYQPCYRVADGEIGLYDLVGGTFYPAYDSTALSIGQDSDVEEFVYASLAKVGGAWQNLVGTDLGDVDTGGGGSTSDNDLLFHFDGGYANDGKMDAAFYNRTGYEISDEQSRFGETSLKVTASASTGGAVFLPFDFTLGADDFTIDFWMYQTSSTSSANCVISFNYRSLGYYSKTGVMRGLVVAHTSSSWAVDHGSQTEEVNILNDWHHVAITREDGTIRVFIDGVEEDSFAFADSFPSMSRLSFGTNSTTETGWRGYIDEFRLRVGEAAWTSNFTPPTQPYN